MNKASATKRFGVIDIGTLKVKFQIVETSDSGRVKTIYQSNNLTCLGCHMEENNNKPKPENLQKTIKELLRCKSIIAKKRVDSLRVVSTHALREMGKVGKEIASLIKKRVGFTVEIISQQAEANLFYQAVLKDFNSNKVFTIVDVGGGSVQILIGNKKRLKHSFLLKTGTSTLWDKFTPRHGAMDYPSREEIRKMRDYILSQLQPLPKNLRTPIIYGSSCIIDLFKGINVQMRIHKDSETHPYKVKVADMEKFLEKVWEIPYDVREQMFISPTTRYMWGVDKAFLNVLELAKKLRAPYIIPSNSNINQGLILDMMEGGA